MRTTLLINDELFAAAKHMAAERQCSLSAIVDDALRNELKRSQQKTETKRFEMLTYCGRGKAPHLTPAEMAQVVAAFVTHGLQLEIVEP